VTPVLRADVVICMYTLARWDLIVRSVESVLAQSIAPQRLIIVVDHNQELLEQCRREWAGGRPDSPVEIIVVANQFAGRLGATCGCVAGRMQLARGRRAEVLTTGLSAANIERARVAVLAGDDA
jgi:hypothetical protein